MANRRNKRPRQGAEVRGGKHAAVAPDAQPSSTAHEGVSWGFRYLDHADGWCWFALEGDKRREVLRKLGELESCTWGELGRVKSAGSCKPVEIDKIPTKAAKDRLVDLQLDDRDHIWEIRLSGTERLWGFRERHVFQLLWWDPDHTVWPSSRGR